MKKAHLSPERMGMGFKHSKAGQPCRLIPILGNLGRWLCVPPFQEVCLLSISFIGTFDGSL